MSVTLNGDASALGGLGGIDFTKLNEAGQSGKSQSASLTPEIKQLLSQLNEAPKLDAPSGNLAQAGFMELGALSADAIMTMLGFEERKSAVKSGISAIETHRQERAEVNQERIEKLEEQAEKAEKAGLLDKIKQVFSYIGMALGAIAAVASIAIGAMTGNALMIAGGALLMASMVDQIASAASDGKVSLAAGFAAAAKATGGNEQAASMAGSVFSMFLGLAGGLMSGGAGIKSAVASGVNAVKIANTVQTASNILNAANSVATGGLTIAKGVYDSQITNLQADSKMLEAILQRIQQASDMDTNQLKKIMERSQEAAGTVKEILQDCNQTLGAVVAGAPAMA